MNSLEKRVQRLEGLRQRVRLQEESIKAWIIVDSREGQTEEGQKAAWLAANPDAAGREIFWVVWITVYPRQHETIERASNET
jgi:hypothetical protein